MSHKNPKQSNKSLEKKNKEIIQEERKAHKKKQDNWDDIDKQTFPASDPVAKY